MAVKEAAVKCPVCQGWVVVIDLGDGRGWWITPHLRTRKRYTYGRKERMIHGPDKRQVYRRRKRQLYVCAGSSQHTGLTVITLDEVKGRRRAQ